MGERLGLVEYCNEVNCQTWVMKKWVSTELGVEDFWARTYITYGSNTWPGKITCKAPTSPTCSALFPLSPNI